MKKLTIKEIAEYSGVGKSTVSRYFNSGYVSQESKEKIEKVINKYNYVPNVFARGIKAKSSKLIGIVVPCLDSVISSTILMSLDSSLRKSGYTPVIVNTSHDKELELSNIENLARLKVEAIIVIATSVTDNHVKLIKKSPVPVLFIGQILPNGYSIVNDEEKAGEILSSYIIGEKFEKVLYIGVNEEDIMVGKIRKESLINPIIEKGIEVDYLETDFSYDNSYKNFKKVYKNKDVPNCIVCATDTIAFGVIKGLKEFHSEILDKVSIFSYGGYKVSGLVTPPISTIRFENEHTGELASKSVIEILNGEEVEKIQKIGFKFEKR
ncbi:HTH-type transcriptional regulator TreR [Fusobacterium sp. DD29]|uniref:LacI family DNA-binding transcriptional regulator n=1 Tax=unclassified Fusobacterium TaxID=2648384 RepID=UPI001B8CC71F|nr:MULTISPECIES: LacI family DNA-binding transcriptional regulator [unclassified Fusobacterium]MBR8700846.1 HTH-type transcriptional regulator TreR [Fusobacterium sp. DD45]MBR8710615.1 HTH-type transcriptional regulator TreR [Fusobacterium sp. DD28]MBR8748643.1 HTH-type transcriptional regulator TreR [Fusobacterium sp. DD29]MBR8751196.1 HTH-type transcriptional regulator TreR [Fusobacterium sp. DD26]MBR8760893.1 HTH-type transcriptional regulator TreR [Fusobacterium sp. DD25]